MLITICPLNESDIDANRIILILRNGGIELGDVFVAAEEVVGEDRYLWLHAIGERRAASADISRCSLTGPREPAMDAAPDDVERYEGSKQRIAGAIVPVEWRQEARL